MSKLKLLVIVVLTVAFLLSMWAIPVVLIATAFTLIQTTWVKAILCVTGALWLLIFRPWVMFRNPRFGRFVTDMRRAIHALLS